MGTSYFNLHKYVSVLKKGRLKPNFQFQTTFCLPSHYLNVNKDFHYCCDFGSLSVISFCCPCGNASGTFRMNRTWC